MLERFPAGLRHSLHVMPGHSRPKDGVASLADDPGIHEMTQQRQSYTGSTRSSRTTPNGNPVRDNSVENNGRAVPTEPGSR
jgi:hypothetical protein